MTKDRYSRQTLFKHIGPKGQDKIMQSHVLIVGVGALGTHLAESLVRAGVGTLTIVDRDYIEYSNLQRQTLFSESDALEGLPKVVAAKQKLLDIRQDLKIHSYIAHVNRQFLDDNAGSAQLILDATDNFETRQLINDFAFRKGIPWIYGGVVQSTYVEAAFIPGHTPCFNCLVPQLPAINMTCDTVGVIQPAVTMTTSLQMRDALKILTEQHVSTKVTYGDLWEGTHFTFGFSKLQRSDCKTCGCAPTYPHLNETKRQFASLCGRDTVQYENPNISQEILETFLTQQNIAYRRNPYMIHFEYNGYRIVSFKGGRLLIHGMTNPQQAITLINQLFG
ncbi:MULTISPECIES: ThiF family adenylyltransferase [Staphylococcus]|uniref:Molybdopterin biosynthesis protein MoeB n=1 Tax=Staphylococcus equorum TaxID=246432 RepID=A0AAP7LT84_9STAP|nr:ThiF family adenylyltransferase [Staphylococcus equorum]ANR68759.1 molybdopterin biosynthesis protein MoeB [Staphylococcus equorum]ERH36242.1 molybdopterin biosynthesis protein MoeB [Staphylococcus equorum UMC-CNS-924]MCE5007449.1 ThiF family adenylyltransferase [Staphylococcus equorum]MCM3073313.1 ThiF family adenylyltransferase [Staphylococcus equorum]MDK9845546.1 ThiF family adenylyltransferase [Staphylococcus equorum]